MISEKEIQDIANKIGNAVDAEKVYLFGSYAKGEATGQSDVDFFIVMKNRDKKKYEIANELERVVGNALPVMQDWIIDYQDKVERFSNIPYSFIGHIVTTGKLLYES